MSLMKKLTASVLSLAIVLSLVLPASASASFTDVSGWAEPYIEQAASLGLVQGVGDNRFEPDRIVSYIEFAAMLINLNFPDLLPQKQEPEVQNPAEPDTQAPETGNPETLDPSAPVSDAEIPEGSDSDAQTPEVQNPAEPDTQALETGNPKTSDPSAPVSDAEIPEGSDSDAQTPETQIPDGSDKADSTTETPAPEVPAPQPEVPAGPWYTDYLNVAVGLKLFQNTRGAEDPEGQVNRRDMAMVLSNTLTALRTPLPVTEQKNALRSLFPDISYYTIEEQDAILTSAAFGLLQGVDAVGNFYGDGMMTRAQAATVLVRMSALPAKHYAFDAPYVYQVSYDQGSFEVPLAGATGYALADIGVLHAGDTFTIIGEQGTYLVGVRPDRTQVSVPKSYSMINLPDVIPTMVYNNTNGEAAGFRTLGQPFVKDGVTYTGMQMYKSKANNPRLGRYEYYMPVSYSMATHLMKAQQSALAQGLTLVLYEGYRPAATQKLSSSVLTSMRNQNADVRAATQYGHFNPAFYVNTIAGGLGSHQKGSAVDISLATVTSTRPMNIGGKTLQVPATWTEFDGGVVVSGSAAQATGNATVKLGNHVYSLQVDRNSSTTMPTKMHETSYLSGAFNDIYYGFNSYNETAWRKLTPSKWWTNGAQILQNIMVGAGLTPLASEWWHFNDVPAYLQVTNHLSSYRNVGSFTPLDNPVMSTTYEYALRLAAETAGN